jgi:death-on-curing protein
LCSRLIRNHPLPDGNKRTAYLCLREFAERNGRRWTSPDPDEAADILEAVAARVVTEDELAEWVAQRLR